eukprot:5937270-Prymnesium_polylepis.2
MSSPRRAAASASRSSAQRTQKSSPNFQPSTHGVGQMQYGDGGMCALKMNEGRARAARRPVQRGSHDPLRTPFPSAFGGQGSRAGLDRYPILDPRPLLGDG